MVCRVFLIWFKGVCVLRYIVYWNHLVSLLHRILWCIMYYIFAYRRDVTLHDWRIYQILWCLRDVCVRTTGLLSSEYTTDGEHRTGYTFRLKAPSLTPGFVFDFVCYSFYLIYSLMICFYLYCDFGWTGSFLTYILFSIMCTADAIKVIEMCVYFILIHKGITFILHMIYANSSKY